MQGTKQKSQTLNAPKRVGMNPLALLHRFFCFFWVPTILHPRQQVYDCHGPPTPTFHDCCRCCCSKFDLQIGFVVLRKEPKERRRRRRSLSSSLEPELWSGLWDRFFSFFLLQIDFCREREGESSSNNKSQRENLIQGKARSKRRKTTTETGGWSIERDGRRFGSILCQHDATTCSSLCPITISKLRVK